MTISNDKQYLLNGQPVSARELIDAAAIEDDQFADGFIKSTSEAAHTLRRGGHEVGENRER